MNNQDAGIVPDTSPRRSTVASHEIRNEAISFLRGHKFRSAQKEAPEHIALRTSDDMRRTLLLHPQYRSGDTVSLASAAKAYVKARIPVGSREIAIALLLSQSEHEQFLKRFNLQPLAEPDPLTVEDEWTCEVEPEHSPPIRAQLPHVASGRKFR